MKRLTGTTILLLLACLTVRADQPPGWREFEDESANKKFVAKVTVKDKNGKKYAWDWSYRLSVYKAADRTKPLWSCDYAYDGYGGGMLADDGISFVNVSFWYYESEPVVSIYRSGKLAKTLKGSDFRIDKSKLQKTASHQLWLGKSPSTAFNGNKELVVRTIDARTFLIDLEKLELKP